MAEVRSNGVFADSKSGGGLFRGLKRTAANTGTNFTATEDVLGSPIDVVSKRDVFVYNQDFQRVEEIL